VLTIHGGGWELVGPEAAATVAPDAAWLNAAGWSTMNIDYRPGVTSIADVRGFYDRLRHKVGPTAPICAFGQSAGGQLALMLAAQRPGLACVIAEGALTDLPSLAAGQAYDPVSGLTQSDGPRWVHGLAVTAFGADALEDYSPAAAADRIRARVLAATSTFDPLVPLEQLDALKAALPTARTMRLDGGDSDFAHAGITAEARTAYNAAKRRLLRRVARASR
jgi:acetyl esterase/lipase